MDDNKIDFRSDIESAREHLCSINNDCVMECSGCIYFDYDNFIVYLRDGINALFE